VTVYLDTNVIIGYCFEEDQSHPNAARVMRLLLEKLGVERFYCSPLTLVELYSYISRNIDKLRLPPELRDLVGGDEELRVRVHVRECLARLPRPITLLSDTGDVVGVSVGGEASAIGVFHKFAEALQFSPKLRLASLDLLHLMYARQLVEHIRYFATLDADILGKASIVEKVLGIKVVGAASTLSRKC
jgi:predicted nucleic acid-binding protein